MTHFLTDDEKRRVRALHAKGWCIWDLMAEFRASATAIEEALRK